MAPADPVDAMVLYGIMNRQPLIPAYNPPQPTIIGTPSGGVICQRTGPNSVFCS